MAARILCLLLALLFSTSAEARVMLAAHVPTLQEITKSFPPEMLYQGKPIDPACVEASNPTEGEAAPQDLKTCAHPPEDAKIMHGLQIAKDGALGYDYECTEEDKTQFCGHVGYRYLGPVKDGFALETQSTNGGTGSFDSIVVAKREGDIFTTTLLHPTGDRCNGGVTDVRVADGKVEYSYNATAAELYDQYKASGSFDGYADSPLDCMAVIHKTDDAVTSIELNRSEAQLANDPPCAAKAYRAQVKTMGKSLSEDQVKILMTKIENACAE